MNIFEQMDAVWDGIMNSNKMPEGLSGEEEEEIGQGKFTNPHGENPY